MIEVSDTPLSDTHSPPRRREGATWAPASGAAPERGSGRNPRRQRPLALGVVWFAKRYLTARPPGPADRAPARGLGLGAAALPRGGVSGL